jgi:hypothetical protein
MTLGELIEHVGAKVGKTDAFTLDRIRMFAKLRWRMIWDAALWRDALCIVEVQADRPEIVVPAPISQVIAVVNATTESALSGEEHDTIMQVDPAAFVRLGQPFRFAVMAPVINTSPIAGWVTLFADAPADYGITCTVVGENAIGNMPYRTNTVVFSNGDPVTLGGELTAKRYTAITGMKFSRPPEGIIKIISPQKLGIDANEMEYPPNQPLPRRARIRLLNPPFPWSDPRWKTAELFTEEVQTLRILGKREFAPLLDDADEPVLFGVDNAWLAFTTADAWEYLRQLGKGQVKVQEGAEHLRAMMERERTQSASFPRAIPWVEPELSF